MKGLQPMLKRPPYEKYGEKFKRTFGVSLQKFWDPMIGFDVFKFDKWVKTPDGVSCRAHVVKTYGRDAVDLIELLIAH